jgi:hypothetical protein
MARIAVRLGPLPAAGSYEVQIAAASAVRQDVPLLVNGAEVARLPFGEATTGPQSFLVDVSAVQLKPEAINEIAFQAPGLTSADSPEALARRVDFYELRLRPAE